MDILSYRLTDEFSESCSSQHMFQDKEVSAGGSEENRAGVCALACEVRTRMCMQRAIVVRNELESNRDAVILRWRNRPWDVMHDHSITKQFLAACQSACIGWRHHAKQSLLLLKLV